MRYLSVCSGIAGRPAFDMLGKKFGMLTVVDRDTEKPFNEALWICNCECGEVATVPGSRLRAGHTKSCGCLRGIHIGALYRTHGKSKTPVYCTFYDARKRATALNLPFTIEPDDIVIPNTCPVLGIKLSFDGIRDHRPSLDRVLPEKGYVPDNINVISFRANRIKSDASADELQKIITYIGESSCAI